MAKKCALGALAFMGLHGAVSGALTSIEGSYSDPNHPDCPRTIALGTDDMTTLIVWGADASGGDGYSCDDETEEAWGPLEGWVGAALTATTYNITVNFVPKGGPYDYCGVFDTEALTITWAGGANTWSQVTSGATFSEKKDAGDAPFEFSILTQNAM